MYFEDGVELKYTKADDELKRDRLPLLRVDGKVVEERFTPDLRTIMAHAQRAGAPMR
ncbi:MAG: hypothetical protein AB9903_08980 [Vulcanimicrobiota bacterium]